MKEETFYFENDGWMQNFFDGTKQGEGGMGMSAGVIQNIYPLFERNRILKKEML